MLERRENIILKKSEAFGLNETEYDSIIKDNEEIISILVKITGTMKERLGK